MKRNWKISAILSGILFFTVIGLLLSSISLSLTQEVKILIVYGTFVFVFITIISLSTYKFKYNDERKVMYPYPNEELILFVFSLILTSLLVEINIDILIIYILPIISWITWVVLSSQNRGNNVNAMNVLIIAWLVISLTLSTGQFLGYTKTLIARVYTISIFLDLRITLSILLATIILIRSITRVEISKIQTNELLIIANDRGNPLLIIIKHFFVLINFIIQILWWLGYFIILWGQACVNEIKFRISETKDTLFDLAIILFSIIGLYFSILVSKILVLEYLPLNNITTELTPFASILFYIFSISFMIYLVIRFKYLKWDNWKLILDKFKFRKADEYFREIISFPILTVGLSSIVLFAFNKLSLLELSYFCNFGLFAWILSITLSVAIFLNLSKILSTSD